MMSEPNWDKSECQHNGGASLANGLRSQSDTRPIYYLDYLEILLGDETDMMGTFFFQVFFTINEI